MYKSVTRMNFGLFAIMDHPDVATSTSLAPASSSSSPSAPISLTWSEAEALLGECSVDIAIAATDARFSINFGELPSNEALAAAADIVRAGQRSCVMSGEAVNVAIIFRLPTHLGHLLHGLLEWVDLAVSAALVEQRTRVTRESSFSSKGGQLGSGRPVPELTTSPALPSVPSSHPRTAPSYPRHQGLPSPTSPSSRISSTPLAPPSTRPTAKRTSPSPPRLTRPSASQALDRSGSGTSGGKANIVRSDTGGSLGGGGSGAAGPSMGAGAMQQGSPGMATALFQGDREDVVFAYTWDPKAKGRWACVNAVEGWGVVLGKVAVVPPPVRLPRPSPSPNLIVSCVASIRQPSAGRGVLLDPTVVGAPAPGWGLDESANLLEGIAGDPAFPTPPTHHMRLSSATPVAAAIPPTAPRRSASRTVPLVPALTFRATSLPPPADLPHRVRLSLEATPSGRWPVLVESLKVSVGGLPARRVGEVGEDVWQIGHGDAVAWVFEAIVEDGAVDGLIKVDVSCVPKVAGVAGQMVRGRWEWEVVGTKLVGWAKDGRKPEKNQGGLLRESEGEGDGGMDGLEVGFVVPSDVVVRRIFKVLVTVVNRTPVGRCVTIRLAGRGTGLFSASDGKGVLAARAEEGGLGDAGVCLPLLSD
ncbi:hypothetical protein M427DRAFT_192142 [Gonapodya prolifera JEL478]|uniref:Uncharacterized protein n=1 Tax=Gonapodya prolifera (strain JEL478) TaxID=1344416 RepID=A0A139A003_GONPJ|nr:hypothetical protein M427DRAFT_192142 [Gonapodya prolifera JEL478]|eukprot:KXS10107.1 hypothetical protein M427DRAFT_192142 [Gonapodya prolifera JEL478]